MTTREELEKACLRCGYEWIARVEGRPAQCPYCKSPKWDIKREVENAATDKR